MKTISKISAVLAIAISSVSFAGDWELFTGGLASFDITTVATSSTTYGISSVTNILPTVAYGLGNGLQVTLTPQWLASGTAGTSATFNIYAGLNYNFLGNSMEDNMFVKAQAGLVTTTAGAGILSGAAIASTSNFGWTVGVGKRFKIVDHVTWAPEVDFNMVMTTGTSTTKFSIVPVQFTMQM